MKSPSCSGSTGSGLDDEKVLGAVSETDLFPLHAAGATETGQRRVAWAWLGREPALGRPRRSPYGRRAHVLPLRHPDATIAVAARTTAKCRVERLPVLDVEDRLVGIGTAVISFRQTPSATPPR
jgi:hypothetical protein